MNLLTIEISGILFEIASFHKALIRFTKSTAKSLNQLPEKEMKEKIKCPN